MPPGARIQTRFSRPDADLLARFAAVPASDAADAGGRPILLSPPLRQMGGPRPMDAGTPLVGPVLPVRVRPGDILMLHAALDVSQPGDVILVAGGDLETALTGELVTALAARRGVAGIVVDGAVRDVEILSVPVFARGTSPRSPSRSAAGEVGYPVEIGGVQVAPGDMLIADGDGVVVVPQSEAPAVLERALQVMARNEAAKQEIGAGTQDRAWVSGALRAAGVAIDEDA